MFIDKVAKSSYKRLYWTWLQSNPCILFTVIHLIEEEAVSEEENSGDEEDLDALHKEADTENAKAGKRKRKTQKEFTAR